jgi:hypothetical protein
VTVKIRVFTLVALLPMALYGQTGSLVGSVASDSLGHPIAGADIRLPALGVTRASDSATVAVGQLRVQSAYGFLACGGMSKLSAAFGTRVGI